MPALRHVILEAGEKNQSIAPFPSFSQRRVSGQFRIVSYNMFWWKVGGTPALYSRLKGNKPFDLLGCQECEIGSVLRNCDLNGFESYQGPKPNPAPLAWNTAVFRRIGGPGNKLVGGDQWGNRHMTWVRLRHISTGANIFFANTHGPLGNCDNTLGNNWVSGVRENKQAGDIGFFTGDFNCGAGTPAMVLLRGLFPNIIDGGIDHILTDQGKKEYGRKLEGSPSDHPLIKAKFSVSGTGSSARNPTNPTTSTCRDDDNQCTYWAGMGECTNNPRYMSVSCKKSCNVCSNAQNTQPTGPACQDENSQCVYWAQARECTNNPAYMLQSCKKSCRVC